MMVRVLSKAAMTMVIVEMALLAPVRATAAARAAVVAAAAVPTKLLQFSMMTDAADERQLRIVLFLLMMLDEVGSQCRRPTNDSSSFRRAIGATP
jgi:hypothetical protein